MTHYDILGVRPTATEDEIEQAHKILSHGESDASRITELNNARLVLANFQSRRIYDSAMGIGTLVYEGKKQQSVNWEQYDWFNKNFDHIKDKNVSGTTHILSKISLSFLYLILNIALVGLYVLVFSHIELSSSLIVPAIILHIVSMVKTLKTQKRKTVNQKKRIVVYSGLFTAILIFAAWKFKLEETFMSIAVTVVALLAFAVGSLLIRTNHLYANNATSGISSSTKEFGDYFERGYRGSFEKIDPLGREIIGVSYQVELYTGHLLEQFKGIPGVRIFHTQDFVNSKSHGGIDHAILSGDNLIFITSEYSTSSEERFWWREDNNALMGTSLSGKRNISSERSYGFSVFVNAIIKPQLPAHLNVYAVTLIHGVSNLPVERPISLADDKRRAYRTREGMDFIGQVVTQNVTGKVDVKLAKLIIETIGKRKSSFS